MLISQVLNNLSIEKDVRFIAQLALPAITSYSLPSVYRLNDLNIQTTTSKNWVLSQENGCIFKESVGNKILINYFSRFFATWRWQLNMASATEEAKMLF